MTKMTKKRLKEIIKRNGSVIAEINRFLTQEDCGEIVYSDEIEGIKESIKGFGNKKQDFLLRIGDLQKLLLLNISFIQKFIYGIKEPLDIYLKSKDNAFNLSNRGSEIEDIVRTVAGIADNTNLLSLNAAIEAAQAGKHGKGFSIVSGVIRKLARNTEHLTRDIKTLTNKVQDGLKDVATNFNEATSCSKDIISIGEGITEDLNNIEKGISNAKELFDYMINLYEEYGRYIFAIIEYLNKIIANMRENRTKLRGIFSIYMEYKNEMENMLAGDNNYDPSKRKRWQLTSHEKKEVIKFQRNSHSIFAELLAESENIRKIEEKAEKDIEEKYKKIEEIENRFMEKNSSMLESIARLNETYMKDRDILEDMIMKISDITGLTDNANNKIKKLKEFIRKIDLLVDNVTYITIQITLLSVNGAIESARAGDAGKGFATVSSDVQELAEASSGHASKIKDLLWDIQGELMKISEEVNQGIIAAKQRTSKILLDSPKLDKVSMDIAILISQINEFQQVFMEIIDKKGYLIKGFEIGKKNLMEWMKEVSCIHSETKKFKEEAEGWV